MYAQNRRNVRSPGGRSVRSNRLRSAPISEECTLKTGGTSAHLEECTLKPPEKCADFGGMYAQNRRNVRSPGGVNVRSKPEERPLTWRSVRSNRRLRSAPISEECTLKTGGTSAHLEECTLKPPPEKCADFGGMYAQNRRNVRSPGGVNVRSKPEERPLTGRSVRSNRLRSVPISEECTLKTGGTSAHLEECTLKPPPEKCADFGGMSVRSNRRLRSAPILEECTLKTGGTSAHLEECTLKPPTEVCRFQRNVRSKPEERPLTWRPKCTLKPPEKCADFGGMSVRSNRRLRSAPILEECTLKTGGTSGHLEECTLKPPEKCADFGGMYALNRRNVRSPGGLVPISEECTLKTGGTSGHLEECTLKQPTEVCRFRRNVRSKPEERPLTWRTVRSNRRLKCADFGGMYAQNRRNVRSPGGLTVRSKRRLRSAPISEECTLKTGGTSAHLEDCTLKPPTEVCRFRRNVRSKPEERPLTWRTVRSNRRLRSAPILAECTLKTGGTSAHLEDCTLKAPTEKCADFGGMYAQNRRNVRSPGGVYAQTAAVRSATILEECTLKTGGTSAHLEECTLKPPEKCADFGGMAVRSNRRLRSAPILAECTLKTGGTSAHLEDCTLKAPTEKCADFGGMYAQNRRNVRSPGGVYAQTAAVRSATILEECTLKTGGTSAHLEECTLKPPEKCADFGGMYAQNRRNVRSPGGDCTLKPPTEVRRFRRNVRSKPEERPLTWRSVRSNRRLKCADFEGMYAQNRRNVRSPGGVYAQTAAVRSVPISEECTLKTGGTSAHLEDCTLKPPEKCADFGGMYAQNRRNVRSPGGVNVRSKPEERPLTWRTVRSNRRLMPILEECTLKTGGTSAHLEDCTLKPPTDADFGGMYAQNRRNVRSPGGVYAQTAA
ncbi:hypothetical protein Bbelb_265560 [Branchiostoma belcheri]|nr:hypothetical protein Bbelb_265560 [Branchiostoma belcheri]